MIAGEFSQQLALQLLNSSDDFPVDFDYAWKWIGYSTKQKAKNKLLNNFELGTDYTSLNQIVKRQTGATTKEVINLTIDCFKSLGMMAGTQQGKEVRRYFLDCERQAKAAAQIIPAQSERIRELELQIEVAKAQADGYRQQRLLGEHNQALLQMHGLPALALILGRPEAIVQEFIEVESTVLCTENGTQLARFEGVTKTALAKRYGLKKASEFVGWLESIGKEGFIIQGMRAVQCEYIERKNILELDKLWAEHKGERQLLIGE